MVCVCKGRYKFGLLSCLLPSLHPEGTLLARDPLSLPLSPPLSHTDRHLKKHSHHNHVNALMKPLGYEPVDCVFQSDDEL